MSLEDPTTRIGPIESGVREQERVSKTGRLRDTGTGHADRVQRERFQVANPARRRSHGIETSTRVCDGGRGFERRERRARIGDRARGHARSERRRTERGLETVDETTHTTSIATREPADKGEARRS